MRSKPNRRRRIAILIGESPNDTQAIRELMVGINPALAKLAQIRREPTFLVKNVGLDQLPDRATQVRKLVAAERVRNDVVCLVTHEDADAFPPEDERLENKKSAALAQAGIPVIAVVPAWEIEAWWFLWPEAAPLVCTSWTAPTGFRGKAVDRVANAKERFVDAVLKPGLNRQEKARARKYQESDGPALARKVVETGLLHKPQARAAAWERFRQAIEAVTA